MCEIIENFDLLPTTAANARLVNSKYYFTGVPCPKGHIYKRQVRSQSCYKCILERAKNRHALIMNDPNKRDHANKLANASYQKHKEKILKRVKKYRDTNPDIIKECKKRYRKNNLDTIHKKAREYGIKNRAKLNAYHKIRRDKNPIVKLQVSLRNNITKIIRNKKLTKQSSCSLVLGCSWEKFKIHIEAQFIEGMCWNNYGKYNKNQKTWSIDHKIPISSAKTIEEVERLNHFTNLQPMWLIDNIMKSNKLVTTPDTN